MAGASSLHLNIPYPHIVIVIVIITYHAVYCSFRASRTGRWFLPCLILWVPGLPEVAHSLPEDPEDRGYRPTKLWGQWQLQCPTHTYAYMRALPMHIHIYTNIHIHIHTHMRIHIMQQCNNARKEDFLNKKPVPAL